MEYVYEILAKTRIGAYFRTTVSEKICEMLKLSRGDDYYMDSKWRKSHG